MALDFIAETIHCNDKYPEFRNIVITNLKDITAYKYDDKKMKFVIVKKSDILDDIIEARSYDLMTILENNKAKVTDKVVEKINDLVDSLRTDKKYRNEKIIDLKLIIYNNNKNINVT